MLFGIWLKEHHSHLPEWVTGLIGLVFLALSLADSLRHRRRFDTLSAQSPK